MKNGLEHTHTLDSESHKRGIKVSHIRLANDIHEGLGLEFSYWAAIVNIGKDLIMLY